MEPRLPNCSSTRRPGGSSPVATGNGRVAPRRGRRWNGGPTMGATGRDGVPSPSAAREKDRFERNNENMKTKLKMLVGTARRAVRNLALFAAVAAATGVWAATETIGGYTWTYRINGDTAKILV